MLTSALPSILFIDLDDTIVSSSLAYNEGMFALGIDPNDKDYLKARSDVKNILPSSCVQSHNRFLYFKKYLENKNSFSANDLLDLMNKYENAMLSSIERQWIDLKRKDLFSTLKNKFKKIVIITNETTRTQVLKVKRFDPNGKLFDLVITSEEVGVEKPDPKIFEFALKLISASPTNCLMVGDSYKNDIFPSVKMQMNAVLTEEFVADNVNNYNLRINSLTDVLNLF